MIPAPEITCNHQHRNMLSCDGGITMPDKPKEKRKKKKEEKKWL